MMLEEETDEEMKELSEGRAFRCEETDSPSWKTS